MQPLNDGLDPLGWALRPRSEIAWHFAVDGAKRHGGLAEIVRAAIDSGIATDAGRLLKRWDWVTWVDVAAQA